MKALTIWGSGLITILSHGPTLSQTNVYHPFPEESAVWRCSEGENAPPCLGSCEFSYTLSGQDTVIGGFTYGKLEYQSIAAIGPSPCSCSALTTNLPPIYFGALRQDISARKVYVNVNSEDVLLYDFTLNVGDTLNGYFADCGPIVISSIDSVQIASQYRKRWNSESYYGQIIEGIGSTLGLFSMCWFENTPNLLCYIEDYQYIYSYSGLEQCGLVYTKEVEAKRSMIYPNPNDGLFKIEITSELPAVKVMIYDATGRMVWMSWLDRFESSLDLTTYSEGIYFISIIHDDVIIETQKLILQKWINGEL